MPAFIKPCNLSLTDSKSSENKKVEVKVTGYELLRVFLPQGEFCRPYCSLSVSSNERFETCQPSGGYDV